MKAGGTTLTNFMTGNGSTLNFEKQAFSTIGDPPQQSEKKLDERIVSVPAFNTSGKMLFDEVIKESRFNDSLEDLGVFRTKSIQAISKQSLLDKTVQ